VTSFRALRGVRFGATACWNPVKALWVNLCIKHMVNESACGR